MGHGVQNMLAKSTLDRLFAPQTVAILGASNDVQRISGRPLHYMVKAGYAGQLFPVNPKRDTVQGVAAYPSLADLPCVPDVALICVGAGQVKQAVTDCVAQGIGAAVIYASGFAEMGDEGLAEQAALHAMAQTAGLRLLGPNCLGLFNAHSGFIGTFASTFDDGLIVPGPVAVVSQSGAYGAHLAHMCRARNTGIGYWASTGNEIDIDVAAGIEWFAGRDDVSTILAYAEGIRNGAALVKALARARAANKAVVFFKAGTSKAGLAAALSHTAALAGEDAVMDAVFDEFGVVRARTAEEHVDYAYAFSRGRRPKGRKVGLVSLSGGFGIQMADAAERAGLEVAPMPAAPRAELAAMVPMGSMANPCDVTAAALNDLTILERCFQAMAGPGGYDMAVGHFTMLPSAPSVGPRLQAAIGHLPQALADWPVALVMLAPADVVRHYEDQGFLVFHDSERAMKSLAALAEIALRPPPEPEVTAGGPRQDLAQTGYSEIAAAQILAAAGISFLPQHLVRSAEKASAAWALIGGPVAMKIVSADIAHKTEIGGVLLNVASQLAVSEGFDTLMARAGQHRPGARIEGVMLVPMAPKGIEVILGIKNDPAFGPVVVLGLGGTLAELFDEVVLRRAPVSAAQALAMMAKPSWGRLLQGYRGAAPADCAALAEMIAALSRFAAANAAQISAIDLNPVVVLPEGQGAIALDAVLETHASIRSEE
jgi:acetate---CoA ligase (ADP-forming)